MVIARRKTYSLEMRQLFDIKYSTIIENGVDLPTIHQE